MNISKDDAIQEQQELFYQTMDSAKVLREHYAQKKSPVEASRGLRARKFISLQELKRKCPSKIQTVNAISFDGIGYW